MFFVIDQLDVLRQILIIEGRAKRLILMKGVAYLKQAEATMSTIDHLLETYRARQAEYAREHHSEYILISKDDGVVGFYESPLAAYNVAKEMGYQPETFLIRECLTTDEEKPDVFHSRVL